MNHLRVVRDSRGVPGRDSVVFSRNRRIRGRGLGVYTGFAALISERSNYERPSHL